jgi:RNA polymerase sigma factor (sigma-70 family)
MGDDLRDRSIWLARHVLPHEALLRAKLKAIPFYDLDVEDIIQETYTRMLSVPSLESIRYPKQYALLTSRAVIVDHMRQSRVVSMVSGDQFESLDIVEPSANIEQRLEIRDELLEVAVALAKLPKLCRDILILRRVEGISQRDVAHRLAISEKTVEKHMTNGVRRLVKLFGRGGKTRQRSSYSQPETHLEDIRAENDADK